MARQIALLRGVNVGKDRKLPMAKLRSALEEVGCTDVTTYIQSGNVVLTPPSGSKDVAKLVGKVASDIAGFDVPVVTRTYADLARIVDEHPYPKASGTKLHVVFFAKKPTRTSLDSIDLRKYAPEHCTFEGKDLFFFLPDGMGKAKLPVAIDKALRAAKVDPGTARNWNTVRKLAELAGD